MEILGLIDIPIWLLFCSTFVFPTVLYTFWKRKTFTRLGITTKPSKFFFGDMGTRGLEYDAAAVRKYGKVFGVFQGNLPFLIITDLEMIKQIMVKDFSNFTERWQILSKGMSSSIIRADGAHWKFLRTMLSPSFTSGKLRKMNTNLSGCLDKLHNNIQSQRHEHPEGFDLLRLFGAYTMDVICSTGFGMDVDSQSDPDNPFVKNAKIFSENQFKFDPRIFLLMFYPDLPGVHKMELSRGSAERSFEFFREASKTLFEERKRIDSAYPDLLQTMLNAHLEVKTDISVAERKTQTIEEMKQRGLTDEEVIDNSLIFMLAGNDTTLATLSWLVYDLALHPDCQEKLAEEIDKELGKKQPDYDNVFKLQYLDMVVNESMRFHPVAIGLTRVGKKDTQICGITIPKDLPIFIPTIALHFMQDYWEEPSEFNPERFSPENKSKLHEYAFLPFGMGPRNCIGMRLALLNVKMTIASLLQKYRFVKTDQLSVPMPTTAPGLAKPKMPVVLKVLHRD